MNAREYLLIPPDYSRAMGNCRWSAMGDAIEDNEGTLVVVEEVRQILEGVSSATANIPHFCTVLQVVHGCVRGRQACAALSEARAAVRGPGASRNLGVLIVELCRGVPPVLDPPEFDDIIAMTHMYCGPGVPRLDRVIERPFLDAQASETMMTRALSEFDVASLGFWLRFGRSPIRDRRLDETLNPPPRGEAELLNVLRQRPRLAGAAVLVQALDAALALPRRKQVAVQQQLGGYCGVATRGDPERLLPSQFALEPADFIRRFAENELLYFRREEPQRHELAERLFVLDQGVRTWGDVRLALTAAVLAALRRDPRKSGPLRIAFTSVDGPPIDPTQASTDQLGKWLEASDLTANPAQRLREALADGAGQPRDVILLTHPRSMTVVMEAARSRSPRDRLFALSVHENGQAELHEWRGAALVCLRAFRVDFSLTAEPPHVVETNTVATGWSGDVGPNVFPFRPGLIEFPEKMCFSASGRWLMLASRNGILHAATLDGSAAEILPNARGCGPPLIIESILGVADGFVVCGRTAVVSANYTFTSTAIPVETELVAAHYDMVRRKLRLCRLGQAGDAQRIWRADAHRHCVTWSHTNHRTLNILDLATGECMASTANSRTQATARMVQDRAVPEHVIPVLPPDADTSQYRGPWVKIGGGVVWVGGAQPHWPPFIPMSEGRRLFDTLNNRPGPFISSARLAGTTLILEQQDDNKRENVTLHAFAYPGGTMLGTHQLAKRQSIYCLSESGRWLAVSDPAHGTQVYDLTNHWHLVMRLLRARLHNQYVLELTNDHMVIRIGKYMHQFELRPEFRHHFLVTDAKPMKPTRQAHSSDWMLTTDVLGGASLWRASDRAIVAMFVIRRNLAAAVLADGTRWGAVELLGQSESPLAVAAFTRAFRPERGAD